MNARLKVGFPALILLLVMVACTLPVEQFPPPDEIQTAAALTLQSMLTPSVVSTASPAVSTATSSPGVTETDSVTESLTATITITPTYSVPILTVLESTNCRTGPGEEYEVIATYVTGKVLEIVGRYEPGNFWLVEASESPTGTCWLWGEFAEITGSYWTVASVTPPATVTGAPPPAPIIIEWNFFCEAGMLNFTVTWRDNANDENGYRIFRNGEGIVELPANTTTYTDLYDVSGDQSVEYYIQVFSPSGTANTSIMRMRCGG